MQFSEPKSKTGACPICGKPVPKRSTRGPINYCSRTCASQTRFSTRYRGSMSGPADRPTLQQKTKYEDS